MPNVSLAAAPGIRNPTGITVGTSAPGSAGTVEIRIGDGIGSDEAYKALMNLMQRVLADRIGGI